MDIVNTSFKKVDNTITSFLSNPVYYGILAIFLAMYGPRLSPRLPRVVRDLFNNNYFRFSVILLVIYMSNKDLSMALIITIAFILIMSLANSQEIKESFLENNKEGFSDFDSIREFYDDEEEFKNPPEDSPENQEDFKDDEEDTALQEPFSEDDKEDDVKEDFENPPNMDDEMFQNMEDDDKEFMNVTGQNVENFTPYEKHLYSVVNSYKHGN